MARRPVKRIWVTCMVAAGAFADPIGAQIAAERVFVTQNLILDVAELTDGRLTAGIRERSIRFDLSNQTTAASAEILTIIDRSQSEGRRITLRYSGAGSYDSDSMSFVFPLCSATLDQTTAGSDSVCEAYSSGERADSPEALIALGMAFGEAGEMPQAREALDRALANLAISSELALVGRRTRGRILAAWRSTSGKTIRNTIR